MDKDEQERWNYETRQAVENAIRTAGSVLDVSVNDLRGEALREFALRALHAATQARKVADRWVEWMADEAKCSGASWQEIGAALGVSKQAAQQRFGR
jgi:hypothetical protein